MLTARKLEQYLEVEDKVRGEFQEKLEARNADLARCQQELAALRQQMQATIDRQLETIAELSGKATANQHTEQLNRELSNRSENLQEEASTLKKRTRALQKDLGEAREQLKVLTQYDPVRMKKNLDANKKKQAELTAANELLQKSQARAKAENADLQRKVQELESKLPAVETVAEAGEEAA
ncbi:MAG: hypothetical protein IPG20_19120 [Gammaproteobacteria bacterium]|nr:hypothetical protein [Gammaproteobacteria bacterium]MBK7170777.1 hypothetical protein [Gammaproteobacteria bacterium]